MNTHHAFCRSSRIRGIAALLLTASAICCSPLLLRGAEPVAAPGDTTGVAPDLAALPAQLAAAKTLETEDLCQPVRSARDGMLLWAPNPDGRSWDLLQIYFPKYGGPNTIVCIDLGSGQMKTVQTDRGWNFHLCPSVVAPNGKLFISILDGRLRQKICIYDPATNELKLDAVPLPDELLGETHPLVLGTDGKLYAIGQHPTKAAAAARIDPDTLEVEFFGPVGPSHEPSACWGYFGAADDRYVYIASGKVPWYLVALDRQTGKSEALVTTGTVGGYVSVSQRPDGCVGSATGVLGADEVRRIDYWLYQGKAIPMTDPKAPPWPAREAPKPLPPRPEVNTARVVPDVEGRAELWVRSPEAAAAAPKAPSADATPEQVGYAVYRYQVPLYSHTIYRLFELPDGRLMGTAGAYEGNFVYDPATGEGRHLGKIGLSHYATAIVGGKVYMSGYPTSPLYVYDPAKPWTAGARAGLRVVADDDPAANPRRLLLLGTKELAGTHKMYAAAVGADGRVYFGGQWIRDGACGGLAWYDPATAQAGGFWQPLSNYQITHMAAAQAGRTIVLSTRRVDDPVLGKPKPDEGALFFFDTATQRLSEPLKPVLKAKGAGPIVALGDRLIGWTANPEDEKSSYLYGVDVAARTVTFRHPLGVPLPVAIGSNQQEAWDYRLGPDGRVWTFIGGALARIDPADGSIEVLGKVARGGPLAFAAGKVYLGGTEYLRRIRDFDILSAARP